MGKMQKVSLWILSSDWGSMTVEGVGGAEEGYLKRTLILFWFRCSRIEPVLLINKTHSAIFICQKNSLP